MNNKIHAIVIKRRQFMENDLSLVLINKEGERVDVIAKGAGTPNSKRRSHLEPINLIEGTLYQSRNHIYLQEVVCIKSFTTLKSNLTSINQIQKFLQIIEKTTYPENPDDQIFDLLLNTIECFNEGNPHTLALEMALTKFANIMGILPNFKSSEETNLELKYCKALDFFKLGHQTSLNNLKTSAEENAKIRCIVEALYAT